MFAWSRLTRWLLAGCLLLVLPSAVPAQVTVRNNAASLTIESWSNAVSAAGASEARDDGDDWQLDAAVRALAQYRTRDWGRLGGRIVAAGRGGAEDDVDIPERSLIWTGRLGRLEYGDRQGLPDVLTGYAANPFTFTTAEFGPASGLSLDPGGGIVQRFIPASIGSVHEDLSALGYASSLFDDRSRKLIYVSPRAAGWLAGISYASQADGEAAALAQGGVVHETYSEQNVLRVGGSYAHLRTRSGEDLDSYFAGASYNWNEVWLLGVGATWNPENGSLPVSGWRSDAVGVTTSLNYNRGPWTAGAVLLYARGRAADGLPNDRLRALETGVSYRTSTRLRVFAAWYRYLLDGGVTDALTAENLITVGLRITL